MSMRVVLWLDGQKRWVGMFLRVFVMQIVRVLMQVLSFSQHSKKKAPS